MKLRTSLLGLLALPVFHAGAIDHTANGHHTRIPDSIQRKANQMIIWNLFDNGAVTPAFYRILLEKDKGAKDEWYDFMVHNIFEALFYADKELNRFNAIGITPKEYISKNYYEVQNMFEQMPRETVEKYCKQLSAAGFWQSMPSDAKGLKSLFYTLNFEAEATEKTKYNAAKDFLNTYTASMYCEFADHFKKK